jgi:hypothetical protein
MSEMTTLPIKRYMVCYFGNCKRDAEIFHSFEEAECRLQYKRETEPDKTWQIYAEVDA